MKENPLYIKSILIITICILTLLVSGFALKETYIEGNRMLRIQSLREANTISDKLFEFTEKSSMVRDITSFILYAPDQATIDKLRPQLTETRLQADAALNAVVESLQGYHDSGFTKNIEDIKTEFIKLKKTRAAIDKEIALPMSQRKRDAAELWFGEATDIIQQNQKIWIEFMKYYSDIDPAVTLHMRFKHFLGVIIEYTGRERAVIGRLIVQNAVPTPQEQANILRWHGSVEMGWERIDSLAEQSGLNPVINPYIKDAKSHYITVYEMVRDIFYVPAVKQNTPYPISVEFWLEISSQATD